MLEQVEKQIGVDFDVKRISVSMAVALLCVLAREPAKAREGLAVACVQTIAAACGAGSKKLHCEMMPFPPAKAMYAIVILEQQKHEQWDDQALRQLLQAAALDLHDYGEGAAATLQTGAQSLWAMARPPFREKLADEECLLVPAAAMRVEVELTDTPLRPVSDVRNLPLSVQCFEVFPHLWAVQEEVEVRFLLCRCCFFFRMQNGNCCCIFPAFPLDYSSPTRSTAGLSIQMHGALGPECCRTRGSLHITPTPTTRRIILL